LPPEFCILLFMKPCRHQELVLLKRAEKKLRCRRCHLTLDASELKQGNCPECLEVRGVRHRDFEEWELPGDEAVLYRCERCGAFIETS
jgi:hypothetical protein